MGDKSGADLEWRALVVRAGLDPDDPYSYRFSGARLEQLADEYDYDQSGNARIQTLENRRVEVDTELAGRLSETELNDLYGAGVRGVAGRKYAVVAGALRNPGSPNYWQTIEDAAHRSTNIDSVTTSTSTITLNHAAIGASRVVAFNITPDETLMQEGYTVGASVGLTSTTLTLGRTYPQVSDYVYYDGSAWVSNLGVFTPSFSAGTLTLTHASVDSTAAAWNAVVTPRDGTYLVSAGSLGLTSMTIQFRDYAGTLITTPNTDMKCYVTHGGGKAAAVNPQAIDTTVYPFSNLWLEAVFEV